MKRSYIFLATGFEEVEALATVDILRRSGMEVSVVSIHKDRMVTGAHGITVAADFIFEGADYKDADWLILPGGMPGASNLVAFGSLTDLLRSHYNAGGHIAAICASPAVVLAPLGILRGRKAVCYPGFEGSLADGGATVATGRVAVDGNVVTANGPASAFEFGYKIVELTLGKKVSDDVASGMLY